MKRVVLIVLFVSLVLIACMVSGTAASTPTTGASPTATESPVLVTPSQNPMTPTVEALLTEQSDFQTQYTQTKTATIQWVLTRTSLAQTLTAIKSFEPLTVTNDPSGTETVQSIFTQAAETVNAIILTQFADTPTASDQD